jgi:ABC-2 type transport system ATP-binding protein
MSTEWIQLEQVHLPRGGRPVLQGVSARVSAPAVGLVGANGSGKSTLIGALLGILRPSSGSIRVLGMTLPQQARDVRARAGVMAEQAGVYPGGSGVDAVTFAGMLSGLSHRESLRRAHKALDALDVGEERYRLTRSYSTGMRQRCKLAMSLVHDPEVLILDEPTVGLDPPGRSQLLSLIRDLRDEGRRILLSTHILQDAQQVCNDLILLEAGVVSYCGPVEALVAPGAGRIAAAGLGLDARFAAELAAAGPEVIAQQDGRIVFTSRGDEDLQTFWKLAHEHGLEVRHLGGEVVTLEDAVVRMMEQEDA